MNQKNKEFIEKPKPETVEFYDWLSIWDYVSTKYNIIDKIDSEIYPDESSEYYCIWNYMVDAYEIHNGKMITLSDWDLKYNNGEYSYTIPDFFKPVLIYILDEFGTPAGENGVREVNILTTW